MPTQITSAGVTFNDTTSLTSANGVPSAIKLTTARTINGVSFDGTGNITIPATSISGANVAKAWVNFNGTTSPGTIRSSYNVSSVTYNGAGDYTVNFATPMADANYTCLGTATDLTANWTTVGQPAMIPTPLSVSSARVQSRLASNGTLVQTGIFSVAIFGN